MQLIDTHCHLASARLVDQIPEILANCAEAGVSRLVTQSTNLADLEVNLKLAADYPEIHTTVGIHPCDVTETPEDFIRTLSDVARLPGVVGIGETGLDYYHPAPSGWSSGTLRALQTDFLRQQLQLAAELGLPVVLHTRDRSGHASFDDALALVRPFGDDLDFVFHCFPGPPRLAARALEAGAHLSFTGIATFRNARDCLEAAKLVPAGRLMVETDAPYLAPVPHRGKRCEPAFVRHTAELLAEARGESLESFAAHTTATARRFFSRGGGSLLV